MSQVARITRVSFRGVPAYLGEDAQGNQMFSGNPDRVAAWMADGYRTRFNQHRSTRKRYIYEDGDRVVDAAGNVALAPLGHTTVDLTDKQARLAYSFLAALPAMVLQHPTKAESREWFSAVKRRKSTGGSLPRFRSRKRSDQSFSCFHNGGQNAILHRTGKRSGMLIISGQNPKQATRKGRWQLRVHVRLSQAIRPYTTATVNLTRKRLTFISPAPTVDRSLASGVVGIDRGVSRTVATSDREFFDVPSTADLDLAINRNQKALARKRLIAERAGRDFRTSTRYRRAREAGSKLHARRSARVLDSVHKFTTDLARRYGHIVLEELHAERMSRKGRGKRGLNRGIRNARWAIIASQLDYKTGGNCTLVPPAYTSQRCPRCGYISPENRESQAVFRCVRCGHRDNADLNAAVNIAALFNQGWTIPAWSGRKTDGPSGSTAIRDETRTPCSA